jgi:hypothetical protein
MREVVIRCGADSAVRFGGGPVTSSGTHEAANDRRGRSAEHPCGLGQPTAADDRA